ncbi:MAG: cystathionine gamma-synthase [Nitrococcus sp.]|nr:cystathionine gamma-synthase [Nitrococcus sp.]
MEVELQNTRAGMFDDTAKEKFGKSTLIARAGIDSDPAHGSVTPPVFLSTNYSFYGYSKKRPYDYARGGNPTRDMLGKALAELESGYHGVITASGMAALDLAFQLLETDDLLIAPHDCYAGTYRLLCARAWQRHFRVTFANLTDGDRIEELFTSAKPAMVLIETPSNPLLRITDIARVVSLAKKVGARTAVDNTFLSPILQKPLKLGADIVIHSTTKYINGHSDVVGGAVISASKELHERLAWWANCVGLAGAPFDSFLTLRGARTMPLRVGRQTESAGAIAEFLRKQPGIDAVYYPGFKTHPGHDIAARQQSGFGAMISLEIKGGEKNLRAFLETLTGAEDSLFSLAESLGGFESLAAHPATMTHAEMDPEARRRAGIGDNLVRLSIGLEEADDLCAALGQALEHAYQ